VLMFFTLLLIEQEIMIEEYQGEYLFCKCPGAFYEAGDRKRFTIKIKNKR